MSNQFIRHRKAKEKLKEIFSNAAKVAVIHYSCESFYDLPDGRSPRITSIAIRNLESGQTESFSIHQLAELRQIPLTRASIEPVFNDLEREILTEFYSYIRNNPIRTYIHWNMRDKNYGFHAIEHRYRVLEGEPFSIEDDKKLDLSRLFIELYGVNYIDHPRLEKILDYNSIEARDFLNGKNEAQAFVDGKYVNLHRSTLRKVDILANIAGRAFDDKLKVKSSWAESRGLSFKTIGALAKEHWLVTSFIVIGGGVSALLTFWRLGAAIWAGVP